MMTGILVLLVTARQILVLLTIPLLLKVWFFYSAVRDWNSLAYGVSEVLSIRTPPTAARIFLSTDKSDVMARLQTVFYSQIMTTNTLIRITGKMAQWAIATKAIQLIIKRILKQRQHTQNKSQPEVAMRVTCLRASDDSISGFQFRYDIDTMFWKYRDINIFKMISM